jgi:hydroxymethylpyrimidine pyrophosphatase-like HAD family hydrolase
MLRMVGCGVAVDNALASVKNRADLVMDEPAGAGVRQLIHEIVVDDLHSALGRASRRVAG